MSTHEQNDAIHSLTDEPQEASGAHEASPKSKIRVFWLEWCKPILIIVIVLSTFRSAVADWNDVPTGSMKPTIIEGDRIFVNKLAYDLKLPFTTVKLIAWSQPERGDVVVLFSPVDGIRLVKRVVAIPGDRIEIIRNRLWINGIAAEYTATDQDVINQLNADQRGQYQVYSETVEDRSHAMMVHKQRFRTNATFGPFTVPEGQYFVMGDNRNNSKDSRSFQSVSGDLIVGQATHVVLSMDQDHWFQPRWQRFFRPLP